MKNRCLSTAEELLEQNTLAHFGAVIGSAFGARRPRDTSAGFSKPPLATFLSRDRKSPLDCQERKSRLSFLLFTVLLLLFNVSNVSAVTVGSGFSAMWFDPARSGEGLQLEILNADSAIVEWFTYNEQGGQRWFQGVGQIVHDASGDSIEFPQLYVTHGGHFGPNFNPNDVVIDVAGNATLSFSDCNTGTFRYNAFSQSQTLPIQRLTQTMGAGCTPVNGVPGQPVMSYAGQSGSWFDISHSGEGFELQWLTNNQALAIWYTYDASGNQVWLLGVGVEQNGAIVFGQMARTSGPHFGAGYDPASYQAGVWGSLTLQLNCNQGTAHYASSQPGFGSGDLTLTRLTTLKQPGCPSITPKLSELYHITWNELPIALGTAQDSNSITAESIATDGTVAGRGSDGLMLWHPNTQMWEDIPHGLAAMPVFISPDGSGVIATEYASADQLLAGDPQHTLLWQRSSGWTPLPGDAVGESWHTGISHNFNYVVGYGRNGPNDPDAVWTRSVRGVQQLLPVSDAIRGGTPLAVSDDGNTVVGITLHFQNGFPAAVAVRWERAGQPTFMHDPSGKQLAVASACDADCSIVYGAGLYSSDSSDPQSGGAWYLKNDGAFEYLSALPDALTPRSYGVSDATSDGSLAVGAYQTSPPSLGYPAATVSRAFIWTEATGTVSVRSLVSELGIGDDDWDEITAVRVSSDGHKILLGGLHRLDLYPVGYSRAVVLDLVPKPASD